MATPRGQRVTDPRAAADLAVLEQAQRSAYELQWLAVQGTPGDLEVAAWERYFAAARDFVAVTAWFGARWGPVLPLSEVTQPFVQALLIRADHAVAAGDHARATAYRSEADELTEKHLDAVGAAKVHRSRAMDAAVQGRFHESLVALDAVRSVFLEAGAALEVARTALQLANLYEWLGDSDRALAALQSVREDTAEQRAAGPSSGQEVLAAIQRQLADIAAGGSVSQEGEEALLLRGIAGELLQAEGRLRRRLGQHEVARAALQESREYAEDVGLGFAVDYHLALVALEEGDAEGAATTLRRIETEFVGLVRPRLSALRLAQARAELLADRPAQALELAQSGLADLTTYPDDDTAWRLELAAARALQRLDRTTEAYEAYRRGADLTDGLRQAPLGYRLDSTYVLDKVPLFAEAVALACETGRGAAAARLIEQVKARGLSATLSIPVQQREQRTAEETRFDEICAALDGLEFATYAGTGSGAIRREREALSVQREDLLERLRIADPRWRGLSRPVPVDVDAVVARLADGDRVALTLFRAGNRVYAALLGNGQVRAAAHQLAPEVVGALDDYVDNLRADEPFPPLFDPSTSAGLTVESIVPPDLVPAVAAARTLVVVPHASLHLLPWAALTVGGRRLFEGAAVGVLPNLSCIQLLDQEPTPAASAVVLGSPDYTGLTRYAPLTEASAELEDLAELYGHDLVVPVVSGVDADEQAFWRLARRRDATLLHVACHGTLEAAYPLQSGLLLTRSKVDAAEVALSRMAYREVVLSACSTGWRPHHVGSMELLGDDALGLTAAFLEAGARFVLVSVPPAQDAATRAFTVTWHRHRRAGLAPLQAYAAVQRDLLSSGEHPLWAWAGMTAYGCR